MPPKVEPELTGWFDGTVKPVRVGVYEVQFKDSGKFFSRWSGTHWLALDRNAERANAQQGESFTIHGDRVPFTWRGYNQPMGETA